jgi:hypothetical protein
MGFGLHAGWAIEGAVGSLQKVDATYLSPHVNMAARLETSSKQYGVPLLASQVTYCAPAVCMIGLVRSNGFCYDCGCTQNVDRIPPIFATAVRNASLLSFLFLQ